LTSVDNELQQILRTAIQREIDAYTLYTNAAEVVSSAPAAQVLKDLARRKWAPEAPGGPAERPGVQGDLQPPAAEGVDLKITDYLVEEPLDSDADIQNVLIVAGKREKASHDLKRP
jgi:hypothetical protein